MMRERERERTCVKTYNDDNYNNDNNNNNNSLLTCVIRKKWPYVAQTSRLQKPALKAKKHYLTGSDETKHNSAGSNKKAIYHNTGLGSYPQSKEAEYFYELIIANFLFDVTMQVCNDRQTHTHTHKEYARIFHNPC